jgi:hypothetical protein
MKRILFKKGSGSLLGDLDARPGSINLSNIGDMESEGDNRMAPGAEDCSALCATVVSQGSDILQLRQIAFAIS